MHSGSDLRGHTCLSHVIMPSLVACLLDCVVKNVGVVHDRSPSTGGVSVVVDLYRYLVIVRNSFQKLNMDNMYKIV